MLTDMKLTTFSDYTLRVLMFLALNRNRLATIPEIAAAYEVSENHLMKVVHQLARSEVIESVRGKGGGIRLAREPEAIRLGQIIRSSEGNAPVVACLSEDATSCCIAPACRLTNILVQAFDAFYESLDKYTLADLVQSPHSLKVLLVRDRRCMPRRSVRISGRLTTSGAKLNF